MAVSCRHGAALMLTAQRLAEMLADAGIPSAPLKGPELSQALYGDPGRRLSHDIDLLVPPERLGDAVSVARRLGYGEPRDPVDAEGFPLLHFELEHERGELAPLELHWRVHWYERRFAAEQLLPSEPAEDWRPEPAAELLALLLFFARDGFVDLRIPCDLGGWWDSRGTEVEPEALGRLIECYPAFTRVLPAAVATAEQIVGVPAAAILGGGRLDRRARMATRMADPLPSSSLSQVYADIALVDGLLTPPGGFLAYVRRQLLPPHEVLEQQARHGARSHSRTRLARLAGIAIRYLVALKRLPRPWWERAA
jgi:hypothetical protein